MMRPTEPGFEPAPRPRAGVAMHLLRCAAAMRIRIGGHPRITVLHGASASAVIAGSGPGPGSLTLNLSGPRHQAVALDLARQCADETAALHVRTVA
jgi:hypothetical protein